MSIIPFLTKHSKEIVLVTTAIIASSVTARSAISQEDADALLGDETPLEKLTRKCIGACLITAGNTIKNTLFIDKTFRESVGGQLLLLGNLIEAYSLKGRE